MSEECDRADCRSRAGLADLGSGRRLFVETSSGAWTIWRRRGAFRFGASDSDIRHAFAPHVNTAVDCGRCVNPRGVRKQTEGAAVCRNTVAQSGKNTTDNGAVAQSSFRVRPIAPHERCSEDGRRAPGQALEKNPRPRAARVVDGESECGGRHGPCCVGRRSRHRTESRTPPSRRSPRFRARQDHVSCRITLRKARSRHRHPGQCTDRDACGQPIGRPRSAAWRPSSEGGGRKSR